jgi:hypothetical protein
MAYSKELQLVNIEPEIDVEPIVAGVRRVKYCEIKNVPRWMNMRFRRMSYDNYVQTCTLKGDEPVSIHSQGHASAAKLRGSAEYKAKVEKMTERRKRIRHHESDQLVSNVRWCGCCTDKSAPEQDTRCCWCAEYGAPDMKPILQDKWGSNYTTAWTKVAKKRKIRPHDKPCASNQQYNQEWPRANKMPATYTLRYGDPYEYTNKILDIFTYEIY